MLGKDRGGLKAGSADHLNQNSQAAKEMLYVACNYSRAMQTASMNAIRVSND
jgi:fructose-bisphosphate aldolase class 1